MHSLYAVLGRGFLREIFLKNAYSGYFIDECVNCFSDKIFLAKRIVFTVPKKRDENLFAIFGQQSLELKSRMQKYVSKYFPQCKIQVQNSSAKFTFNPDNKSNSATLISKS